MKILVTGAKGFVGKNLCADSEITIALCFAVFYVIQLGAEVLTYEAFCACY